MKVSYSEDHQLIVRELGSVKGIKSLRMVAGEGSECVKFLKFNDILLTDSFSFITTSLAKAVDELKAGGHGFDLLKSSQLAKCNDQFQLLLQKGNC